MTVTTAQDGKLTASLRRLESGAITDKARLAVRLAALSAAFAEDYDGQFLSTAAVDAFIDFLESAAPPGYPELTATPAGDLYAEWHGDNRRRLTIEFLASGDARYLIFVPNPRHPQRVDKLAGSTTADALGETIAPLLHLTGLAA